jgi:hypothetical protein
MNYLKYLPFYFIPWGKWLVPSRSEGVDKINYQPEAALHTAVSQEQGYYID